MMGSRQAGVDLAGRAPSGAIETRKRGPPQWVGGARTGAQKHDAALEARRVLVENWGLTL